MKIKDLFSKFSGDIKEPKVEQNEMESEMNGINVNLTPEELQFTSLCVKSIGTILREKPDAFSDNGILGLLFKNISQEVDMTALFEKFAGAMLKDMLYKYNNRKY